MRNLSGPGRLDPGMRWIVIGALATALLLPSAAQAQNVIPGAQAQQNVSRLLSQVPWTTSLEQAKAQAQKEGKLIFWVHMLGSLNGDT